MKHRRRLDEILVDRGLAPSRARARDSVERGRVSIDGVVEWRAGRRIGGDEKIEVDDPALHFVSRGALKLAAGLDSFGFDVAGRTCADLGTSTGGFTQVLLERGARRVYAVDVGRGQLDPALADDSRIVALEGLNARDLTPEHVPERLTALVADLSFISLRLALPPALALTESGSWGVFLVKPQFEVGRGRVGKGGIVRDSHAAETAARSLAAWMEEDQGWRIAGLVPSPITGGDGNREFLLGAERG